MIDNRGSPIVGYELQINDGTVGSAFTNVASFASGTSYPQEYSLTLADGLIEGRIYAFRWYAFNSVGNSKTSEEVFAAVTAPLQAPLTITKDRFNSSKTSITVQWSATTPGTSPGGDILGYLLQVEDTNTGETWIAFNGYELSLPTQY